MYKVNKKKTSKITTKHEHIGGATPSPIRSKLKFKKWWKVWIKTKNKEFKEILKSARSKYSSPTHPSSRYYSEEKPLRINARVNSTDQFDYVPYVFYVYKFIKSIEILIKE